MDEEININKLKRATKRYCGAKVAPSTANQLELSSSSSIYSLLLVSETTQSLTNNWIRELR